MLNALTPEAREQRQLAALRDVDAALENLIEVVDLADELPVDGSRAGGAIAVAAYAAQSARANTQAEIRERERALL